jgi:hypothetical protein
LPLYKTAAQLAAKNGNTGPIHHCPLATEPPYSPAL